MVFNLQYFPACNSYAVPFYGHLTKCGRHQCIMYQQQNSTTDAPEGLFKGDLCNLLLLQDLDSLVISYSLNECSGITVFPGGIKSLK